MLPSRRKLLSSDLCFGVDLVILRTVVECSGPRRRSMLPLLVSITVCRVHVDLGQCGVMKKGHSFKSKEYEAGE